MDQTVAALVGALVGAVAAVLGAGVSAWVALQNERRRQDETRRASYVQELRNRTATTFTDLYSIQYAIEWITWYAHYDPETIDSDVTRLYHGEVQPAQPKMSGALATVAALNLELFETLQPLIMRVLDLEGRITLAVRGLGRDRAGSLEKLANYHERADSLGKELPRELGRLMRIAEEAAAAESDRTTRR